MDRKSRPWSAPGRRRPVRAAPARCCAGCRPARPHLVDGVGGNRAEFPEGVGALASLVRASRQRAPRGPAGSWSAPCRPPGPLAANCPARELRFSVAAMMSSVWPFSCEMKVSSCTRRLFISSSRPLSAVANAWLISWSWPRPPPLSSTDTEARSARWSGGARPDSGIKEPFLGWPCGASPVGAASSMLGAQQAGLSDLGGAVGGQVHVAVDPHRHQACQSRTSIPGDVADVDVGHPHPGVLLDGDHVGSSAWMV